MSDYEGTHRYDPVDGRPQMRAKLLAKVYEETFEWDAKHALGETGGLDHDALTRARTRLVAHLRSTRSRDALASRWLFE